MSTRRLLAAVAVALFAPGLALAAGTVTPQLRSASQSLAYSTQQLANVLRSVAPADRFTNDAGTLYDAAEHFQEEVNLGPEDLPVDYQAVQQTYGQAGQDYAGDYAVQNNPQVRTAWASVQQSLAWVNQAWNQSPQPQPNPYPPPQPQPNPYPPPRPTPIPVPPPQPQPRPVVCYAQNLRGQVFQATAWYVGQAQAAALQLCEAHSWRCELRGCQYY